MSKAMFKPTFIDSEISMAAEPQFNLTEGQKDCLRLVAQHQTSKEIARELGISPFTVDQRLDFARRKLNTKSRKDAARIFVAWESGSISDPTFRDPSSLNSHLLSNQSSILSTMKQLKYGRRGKLSEGEILVRALNAAVFGSLIIAFVAAVFTGTFRLLD